MKKVLAFIFTMLLTFGQAQADTITFEGAVHNTVADGFDGFNWGGLYAMPYASEANVNVDGGDTFLATAFSTGFSFRQSVIEPFTFYGADFHSRAGLSESTTFSFRLYDSAGVGYSESGTLDEKDFIDHTVDPGTTQTILVPFTQPIYGVAVVFKHNNDWKYFGMDNVQVASTVSPVPEPPVLALMLAGLVILTIKKKRN